MQGISLKSEKGSTALTVVAIVIILATLGVMLASINSSESILQVLDAQNQRAFYSAQSGIEYGVKKYLTDDQVKPFEEKNVEVGPGMTADVSLSVDDKNNTATILSVGKTEKSATSVQKTILQTDLSYMPAYAAYSPKPIVNVAAKDSIKGKKDKKLIYQNAPRAPKFDLDNLRTAAKQVQSDGKSYYFAGDLTVDADFNPPDGTVVFTEGKLKLKSGKWAGKVNFVALDNISFSPSWRNSNDVNMTLYLANSDKKIWVEPGNYDDDPIDFDVDDGEVVPKEPYAASITIIGGDLPFGWGWPFVWAVYDAPITVSVKVGHNDKLRPFGSNPGKSAHNLKHRVDNGNVNLPGNPRTAILPNKYPADTRISVLARSWAWSIWRGGAYHLHMKVNSAKKQDSKTVVRALRDGDPVPNVHGFGSQKSAAEFIAPYVNFSTHRVTLDDNQIIYLFELATHDLSSPAADFQDLVVLVSLAKEKNGLGGDDGKEDDGEDDEEDDEENDKNITVNTLQFHGGVISEGAIFGSNTDKIKEKKVTNNLQIIRDEDALKKFMKYSLAGSSRIILASKWKNLK